MGRLFLPRETHGLWDAPNRSLTVFTGEDAYVGFQGTHQEIDVAQFSAYSPSLGECSTEVYDEGPGRLSTNIITTRPGTARFEVTDGESKQLAQPATVYIRMRPDYRRAEPEGQLDETACWAACLAFWLRVLPDRPSVDQSVFINKLGVGLWNKSDGTIKPLALEQLVLKQGYRMKTERILPNQLRNYMGYWPLILGFTASGGFGHMNVLVGYDSQYRTVDTMEPMYPDPVFDSDYDVMEGQSGVPLFYNKATGAPFKYKGAVRTGLSFDSFANSPMKAGYFWVGYPQEYTAQP